MEDRFGIDGHKLMYHVKRVADWLDNKLIYPIYVEISPGGTCNHRCVFCSMDFMGYKKQFLDTIILKERITELSRLGIKSIMFAGEGEPLIHRDLPEIIVHTKKAGIDVAITSNGVLLKPGITDTIINSVEWIKISINAGTAETYSKIHGTKEKDFYTVLSNIEYAVKVRNSNKSQCRIGMQILLIPENYDEVELLAEKAKAMGVDYLVIKPYTHHYKNSHKFNIKYREFNFIEEKIKKYNTEKFNIIFRTKAMKKWDKHKRDYLQCNALPFWSYIDSKGNVWGCSSYLLEERFRYGSIINHSFEEIWKSKKRRDSLKWVATSMNIKTCKMNCRMDEINIYLDKLKNPPEHVNFI